MLRSEFVTLLPPDRKGGALAPPWGPSPTTSWSPLSRFAGEGPGERGRPVTAGLKPRPSRAGNGFAHLCN